MIIIIKQATVATIAYLLMNSFKTLQIYRTNATSKSHFISNVTKYVNVDGHVANMRISYIVKTYSPKLTTT